MPFDADLPPQFLPRDPFRGSSARASGLITPGVLREPRFRRLFPTSSPPMPNVTLILRARAAYLLVEGRGAIGGYAAAELLGASCGPKNAPVDLVVPGGAYRPHPGLTIHRGLLAPDEIDGRSRRGHRAPTHGLRPGLRPTAGRSGGGRRRPQPRPPVRPADVAGLRPAISAPRAARSWTTLSGWPTASRSPRWSRIRLIVVFDRTHPVCNTPSDRIPRHGLPGDPALDRVDGEAHLTQERALRDLTAGLSQRQRLDGPAVHPRSQVLYRPWEVAARSMRYQVRPPAGRRPRQGAGVLIVVPAGR